MLIKFSNHLRRPLRTPMEILSSSIVVPILFNMDVSCFTRSKYGRTDYFKARRTL